MLCTIQLAVYRLGPSQEFTFRISQTFAFSTGFFLSVFPISSQKLPDFTCSLSYCKLADLHECERDRRGLNRPRLLPEQTIDHLKLTLPFICWMHWMRYLKTTTTTTTTTTPLVDFTTWFSKWPLQYSEFILFFQDFFRVFIGTFDQPKVLLVVRCWARGALSGF